MEILRILCDCSVTAGGSRRPPCVTPRRICLSPFQGLRPTVRNSVLLSLPLRITLCSLGLHVTFAFGEQPTGLTFRFVPQSVHAAPSDYNQGEFPLMIPLGTVRFGFSVCGLNSYILLYVLPSRRHSRGAGISAGPGKAVGASGAKFRTPRAAPQLSLTIRVLSKDWLKAMGCPALTDMINSAIALRPCS